MTASRCSPSPSALGGRHVPRPCRCRCCGVDRWSVRASQRHFRRQQALPRGRPDGIIEESFAGPDTSSGATAAAERALKPSFDEVNEKLLRVGLARAQFLSGVMQPIMGLVGNLGYVAVVHDEAPSSPIARLASPSATRRRSFSTCATSRSPSRSSPRCPTCCRCSPPLRERIFEFLAEHEEAGAAPTARVSHARTAFW
ncbi:MAG: hypothetical protein ACLTSX_00450 [Collinsella sp.]